MDTNSNINTIIDKIENGNQNKTEKEYDNKYEHENESSDVKDEQIDHSLTTNSNENHQIMDIESGHGTNTTNYTQVPTYISQKIFSKSQFQQISPNFFQLTLLDTTKSYISKFYGIKGKSRPTRETWFHITWNFILSFTGTLLISVTDYFYLSRTFHGGKHDFGAPVAMLIGSFGATSLLVYDSGLYSSPAAQPRNVIGGHLVSSFIGVSVRLLCGEGVGAKTWIQAPLAVGIATFFMDLFECIHPPGGATALIAVIGGQSINDLGYGFVATCVGGAFISICFACVGNNLIPFRQYPVYWW